MAKWNADELSLLRCKGDGDVRGLSVLINATAISSSVPMNDWRYYICSFLSAAFMSVSPSGRCMVSSLGTGVGVVVCRITSDATDNSSTEHAH